VADSDFFNEDPANPLELTTYDNGVAVMTGSVISDSNPDQRFDVFVTFEAGQDAAEWEAEDPAHGYLVAFGCEADIETVYTLKGDQSYMVGQGEYAGDLITLSHMPVSENKRFQLGTGGNSHNCNYGFGGWFAWSGTLLNAPAGGMSGDIIVDLEEIAGMPAAVCGQEVTTVFYTAMEESCDYVETHVQTITRMDTMGPEFTSAPEDTTVECDAVPAVPALEELLGSGELSAMDNCDSTDEPIAYSYDGETINATDCDSQYEILRTWTATDCSGNATSYTQVITIEDMTAPAFVEALPADITVECDAVPAADVLTAIDNCDAAVEVMFNESITDGICAQTYTVTRIWTVSDCAGNVTEHVQTILVVDTTAPIIDMEASNLMVECDGAGNSAELEVWLASSGGAEASDACSDVTWSNDFASLSDDCGATGMATVTFTATDDCGNSSSTTATFTIEDTTAPVIDIAGADAIAECDGAGNAADLDAWLSSNGGAEASDACSDVTWSNDYEGLVSDCGATGSTIVTFTATDDCGNSSSTTAMFTIEDTTAPVFEAHEEFIMASCGDLTDATDPTQVPLTATDNCGTVTYTIDAFMFSGGCPGTWMRQWTATDACGNNTSTLQFVTMYDDEAPVFTSTPDAEVVLEAAADCNTDTSPAVTGMPTVEDNCGPNVDLTLAYEDSEVTVACPGSYTFTRSWTATDFCGNESVFVQSIYVEDTIGPAFTMAPEDQVNQCEEQPYAYEALDNCSNPPIIYESRDTLSSDDCGNYVHLVTLTAYDVCGNTSEHQFTITVDDTSAPMFDQAIPDDATVECGTVPAPAVITATDNCDATVGVSFNETITPTACDQEYTITRTWETVDCSGNTNFAVQTITVEDTTAPAFVESLPADLTVECDAVPVAEVLTSTDDCDDDSSVSMVEEIINQTCNGAYTLTRTWTATDCAGNATDHVQTITVIDTTAPTIDVEASNLSVECDGAGNAADLDAWLNSNGGASASDACGDVTWSNDFASLSDDCGATGLATVTFTATDDCGNSSSTTATFTIEDTTAPTIDMAAMDATVECDGSGNAADLDAWLASNGGASASDACSDVTWSNDFASFSDDCGATGMATVTFTVTDDCGNSSSTTATFTIEDTTAPSIDMAAVDATAECDGAGNAADLDTWLNGNGGASASDACSDVSWSNDFASFSDDCGATGMATVTFTATDDCGNSSSTTATFTIEDTTAPAIDMAAVDATAECDGAGNAADLDAWLASNGGAAASDGCGDVTWSNDYAGLAVDCGATGSTTVTFTATDDCGNSSSTTATFSVEDTTAPAFAQVPGDQTSECEEMAYTALADDVCSAANIAETRDVISEDDCGNYEHLVTLTATDACGNSTSHSFTIIVSDTTAPVIEDSEGVEDGSIVAVCAEDIWGTISLPDALTLSVSDNCNDEVEVTVTETYTGDYAPTEDVAAFCLPNNPASTEDGLTCDNFTSHAARLFNFPGGEFYTLTGGLMSNYVDGTAHITMDVVSMDNPNAGWTFEIDLNEGLNWQDWIDQPGPQSYKSDCGLGDHTEWMYYILQGTSTATGWGEYEGSELALSHQPSNGFFGFQVGEGANNKNANHGYSGWFYYIGTFNGADVMGTGDVFADIDCSLPWGIEREYTVTDCSGNTTSFAYTVDVNGLTCEPIEPTLDSNDDNDDNWSDDPIGDDGIGLDDGSNEKPSIKVLGLTPNPASDIALLTFMTESDAQVGVHLYGASGMLVATLWEGQVFADVPMNIEVPASMLENGLYQIQILSASGTVTTKLLVNN
jgi:hypothetical protein